MNIYVRNAVAEAIGVFALCFIGMMAIKSLGDVPGGLLGIALAHGLAIGVMVAALGHVSGGQFNPAVTIGLLVGRKIEPALAAVHIVAQLLGGLLAAAVVAALYGSETVASNSPALNGVGVGQAILLEAIATFFLVFVVFGTAVDDRAPKGVYPLVIGLTISIGIIAIGPITGGALNPARGFGPSIIGGNWSAFASYTVGPILGGIVAALIYTFVTSKSVAAHVADVDLPDQKSAAAKA